MLVARNVAWVMLHASTAIACSGHYRDVNDASTLDASDAGADVDPSCTPFDGGMWCDQLWIDEPVHFCRVHDTVGTSAGDTPAECRCQETFGCACLNAHLLTPTQRCGFDAGLIASCHIGGPFPGGPWFECQ